MKNLFAQEDNVSTVSPNRGNLSQDYLKSLQSAMRAVTKQKDIPSAYKNLADLLSDITSYPNYDGYFQDLSTRTYFFEDFLTETVSYITSLEKTDRNEINDVLNRCLLLIIRLWKSFLFMDATGSLKDRVKCWAFLTRLNSLLKYTLKKNILRIEDLQLLWEVIKQNQAVKSALFEGFLESQNSDLKAIFVDYMILQFSENSAKKTRISDFELVSSLFDTCTMSDQLLYRYIDFSWRILSKHSASSNLSEIFIKKIKTLIEEKKLTEDNKQKILCDCPINIENEKLTLVSFKVIRTLMESYPLIADNENKLTRSECICHLCEEQGILSKVIKELKFCTQPKTNHKNSDFLLIEAGTKSEIIEFIAYLTTQFRGCGRIITYEVLHSLWEMIHFCQIDINWRGRIAELFIQIIQSISGIGIKNESLERLLNDMNPERFPSILKITDEEFKCIRSVLVALNESLKNISEVNLLIRSNNDLLSRFERLQISKDSRLEDDGDFHFQVDITPRKVIGYKTLWELTLRAEDEKVATKARDLLVILHTNINPELYSTIKEIRTEYLEQCFYYLKGETEQLRKVRSLNLIHAIIAKTDQDCLKHPKLHCELSKGAVLNLTIKFEKFLGTRVNTLEVHSNMLVSDFITELERHSTIYGRNVCFEKKNSPSMEPIYDIHNTRTLQSLGIKDQDGLLVKSRRPPKAFLIQHDCNLNPRAREIFAGWFECYSDNGKMSPEQCAAFVHSCTNDFCKPNDSRVRNIFAEYDDDKDGYLTLENFLSFYLTQCWTMPFLVWNNLYAHNITYNLKPPKDTLKQEMSASLHITSLIHLNDNYIQLLFSLLDSEENIATTALELLNRLPTNPRIFADIVLLKGVRDISGPMIQDWNKVLDRNNLYRLSYSLSVVEYLLDPGMLDDNDNKDMKALWTQDPLLSEYKKTWTSDFLVLGGFEHLQHILNDLLMLKSTSIVDSCRTRIKYILSSCKYEKTL